MLSPHELQERLYQALDMQDNVARAECTMLKVQTAHAVNLRQLETANLAERWRAQQLEAVRVGQIAQLEALYAEQLAVEQAWAQTMMDPWRQQGNGGHYVAGGEVPSHCNSEQIHKVNQFAQSVAQQEQEKQWPAFEHR
jgi:hypothetical protein